MYEWARLKLIHHHGLELLVVQCKVPLLCQVPFVPTQRRKGSRCPSQKLHLSVKRFPKIVKKYHVTADIGTKIDFFFAQTLNDTILIIPTGFIARNSKVNETAVTITRRFDRLPPTLWKASAYDTYTDNLTIELVLRKKTCLITCLKVCRRPPTRK